MTITWQNINSPNNSGAMQGFAAAGQNFNSAFDKLGDMLKGAEAAKQYRVDQADDSNVLALKEALSAARTPEEVMALQGQLNTMRSGLTNKGRTAVLGAEEARTSSLQQQITARNAFTDGLRNRDTNIALENERAPVALANAIEARANQPREAQLTRAAIEQRLLMQPATDALALSDLTNRVAIAPTLQSTAVTNAQNANRAALFAQENTSTVEALAKQKFAIDGSTLSVQGNQTQNTLEDQNLSAFAAKASAAYQNSQLQDRIKLGALATKRGYPVDASGAPDVKNMKSVELVQLNADAGLAGLRSTNDLFAGDTKAAMGFRNSLTGFSPEAIARNEATINKAFSTVNKNGPIGADAQAVARAEAEEIVMTQEKDSRNWYAPGSKDARNSYEVLAKEIELHPSFKDSAEDLPHVQNLLKRISETGLKTKNGEKVVPSVENVMGAIRSTYEGWNIRNRGRAEDIEKNLIESLSTSDVTKLLADSKESEIVKRRQAIKEILNGGNSPQTAPAKK